MKKKLLTRQTLVITLVLAAIVMLLSVYLFQYVPQNEDRLKARRFRALERTQLNLEKKLLNSFQFLETQINSYADQENNDTAAFNRYLDQLDKINQGAMFDLGIMQTKSQDTSSLKPLDELKFDHDSIRCFCRRIHNGTVYELTMNYGIESFVRSLLPRNLFDEFIFIRDTCILFASFPTGNQAITKDSILNFSSSLPVSSEGRVKLSGEDYRIFLQPLQLDHKSRWLLGGLMQEDRFLHERYQFDPRKVLSIITIAIILLILLPWIKLFFMGSRDRLTHVDGFLSYLVAMFMMCMLFFVFTRKLPGHQHTQALTNLSGAITKSFQQELNTADSLLKRFDRAIYADKFLQHDFTCLGDRCQPDLAKGFKYANNIAIATNTVAKQRMKLLKDSLENLLKGIKFNHVYWLDKNGKEIFNWSADTTSRPHQNFSERRYFKAAPQDKRDSSIVIDPLISWTTGEFRTVMSRRSKMDTSSVVAISFNLPSMEHHLLPEGYLAMIINWRGQVIYDTEEEDNLNEYLPEEFADSSQLKSAIYAGTTEDFVTSYLGSKYYVHFSPLNHQYFLLLLKDQAFENSRDINAFSFALIMYALFFILIFLQFICMVSLFHPVSRLKFKTHWIDTLFPSHALEPAYRYASVGNMAGIVILLLFSSKLALTTHICILLVAVAINMMQINLICAEQHSRTGNQKAAIIKRKNVFVLGLFLLLYNGISPLLVPPDEWLWFFVFEVLTAAVALFLPYFLFIKRRSQTEIVQGRFIRSYTWMAVSRMIITSGIPVMFFYMDAYNYEQTLQNRHAQKYFGYRYAKMSKAIESGRSQQRIFIDSILIKDYGDSALTPDLLSANDHINDSVSYLSEEWYDNLRVLDDSIAIANNKLYKNSVANDEGLFIDTASMYIRRSPVKDKVIWVKSQFKPLHIFSEFIPNGLLNWLLLIGLLIVYFQVIQLILRKVFAVQFAEPQSTLDIANYLPLQPTVISPPPGPPANGAPGIAGIQHTVIIAPPGSGVDKLLQQLRITADFSNKIFLLDLHGASYYQPPTPQNNTVTTREWSNAFDAARTSNCPCLVIHHFEYLLQHTALLQPLIDLLEYWQCHKQGSVTILSGLHPFDLPEWFQEQVDETDKKKAKQALGLLATATRLEALLGNYNIVFIGLQAFPAAGSNKAASGFLQQETKYGDFLHDYFNTYKNEAVQTNAFRGTGIDGTVPAE